MGRIIKGCHGLTNFIGVVVLVCLTSLPLAACGLREPAAAPEKEQAPEEDQQGEAEEWGEVEEEEEEVDEQGRGKKQQEEKEAPEQIEMEITSAAFSHGGAMPTKYTCYGQDVSPELSWRGAPEGTRSFALTVDDPHAPVGTFTYWVIFNIPADTFELAKAVPTTPELPSGVLQGKNDFDMTRYGGACPLWDTPHHYHFVLYALDRTLNVPAGVSRVQVVNAMEGHILAQAELTVTYNH